MAAEPGSAHAGIELVSCRFGTEWYAVPIAAVREIVRCGPVTFVPGLPAHIRGLTSIRGTILSVTDPKPLFGLPLGSPATELARLIVIDAGGHQTAVLVDEVDAVFTAGRDALEPPMATLPAERARYVTALCRLRDRVLAVLNPATHVLPAR